MAGKLNLKINQGETFRIVLRWLDSTETPIDLSGYEARMHIRPEIDSEVIFLKFASDPALLPDGTITLIPAEGEIHLYLDALQTAAIDWECGVYDLEMYTSTEEVTRLIEGRVTVSPEVTR